MIKGRKGWIIKQSFTDDFVDLMESLYKKYGDDIFAIQGIANKNMDLAYFSKEFFGKSANSVSDLSVDANANVCEKNIMQYNYESGKALMKLNSLYLLYKWVKKFYKSNVAYEAVEKIVNGEIFCNDLVHFSQSYCYSFELRNLMLYGMNFFKGNMKINPPNRSESLYALMIQTTAYISNQIVGASAFPDWFVVLDYYYRKELGDNYMFDGSFQKDYRRIKNQFQNLIFSLNYPFRGGQSAFTNLSVMDRGFLSSLFKDYTYPDFTKPNIESVYELSKKFFEYFAETNGKEGIFTFPIMTMAISLDKNNEYIDSEFVDWVSKVNCEKSLANIFQSAPTSFSSCCRLINDYEKIGSMGFQNSLGVGGISIGSHRVVGLNLPRMAILEKENPNIIESNTELACKILIAHRKLIEHRAEIGSLPLYKSNWINLKRQYSTIGFVGAYEYVVNKGFSITSEDGIKVLTNTLNKMESVSQKWQKNTNSIFNQEQIPAESMSVRLAEIDKILGYNKNYKLYSNQYIPLTEKASIHDRFRIQGNIDNITTGGAILHINVDDEKPLTERQFKRLIEEARKTKTKYFAVNYAYSQCENNHYSVGKHEQCPICDTKIINQYTRVVGFITSINSWNKTRREYEYKNRFYYKNSEASGEN